MKKTKVRCTGAEKGCALVCPHKRLHITAHDFGTVKEYWCRSWGECSIKDKKVRCIRPKAKGRVTV